MEDFNLIIGIHSVACALENEKRTSKKIYATDDGLTELKKRVKVQSDQVTLCSSHKLQELAKDYFKQLGLEYQRVPSGVFLVCSELETMEVADFYQEVSKLESVKILCLDQISDVHNAGAIMRTANFYGVDFVIIPDKKSFGLTPSFFRIASGAAEYINVVTVSKLTKLVTKLNEFNITSVALSEHANATFKEIAQSGAESKLCLILGKEDTGISNAVLRLVKHHVALQSQGETQSLNVAAAAAISMEKCFGNP